MKNQIPLFHVPTNTIASYILFLSDVGTKNENNFTRGISHLSEHIVLSLICKKCDELISALGIGNNGYTRKEYTTFALSCCSLELVDCLTYFVSALNMLNEPIAKNIEIKTLENERQRIQYEERKIKKERFDRIAIDEIQSYIMDGSLKNKMISETDEELSYALEDIDSFVRYHYLQSCAFVIVGGTTKQRAKYEKIISSLSVHPMQFPEAVKTYYGESCKTEFIHQLNASDNIYHAGWKIPYSSNFCDHVTMELTMFAINHAKHTEKIVMRYLPYRGQTMIYCQSSKLLYDNLGDLLKNIENILTPSIWIQVKSAYLALLLERMQINRLIAEYSSQPYYLFGYFQDPSSWFQCANEIQYTDMINNWKRITNVIEAEEL